MHGPGVGTLLYHYRFAVTALNILIKFFVAAILLSLSREIFGYGGESSHALLEP